MSKMPKWLPYVMITAVLGLFVLASQQTPRSVQPHEISYSDFKARIAAGDITEVVLRGDQAEAFLVEEGRDTLNGAPAQAVITRIPAWGDPALLPLLEKHGVEIITQAPDQNGPLGWLSGLLPWILLFGVYIWFWSRMQHNIAGRLGGRDFGEFLSGAARRQEKGTTGITFDDVAGQENAKREVSELVDFLRDPKRYRALGAEPPHGVLLMGPPGTGKTLLARALAGEAGVEFFHISASEFIEMFVGVGASRVRKMFKEAKKRAPAIIFIDELDAVGRARGTGMGGGNDEREQTLNQILSEMDGFAGHEAVIVLAATNRPDVLDPALLRPGRFDRHVTLELPDKEARRAILAVHIRKVPLDKDVNLDVLAAGTPGFSGADLKNLVNEAAMAAARKYKTKVAMHHFDEMRDKIMMGTLRSLAIQPEERHRLATHEAGHTLLAHHLPDADPLYKVTIIPRGRALGGTQMLPEEERHTLPEGYLRDRLAVLLGGRTAEKLLLEGVSSGADDDIRQATKLARAMVARWGMSEAIGPIDLRQSDEHPFLGREIAQPRSFSEATARSVDEAVQQLLQEAEGRASKVIERHKPALTRLIAALEAKETLDREAIEAALGPGAKAPAERDIASLTA